MGLVFLNFKNSQIKNLTSPGLTSTNIQGPKKNIEPTAAPVVYKFDKSTDLRSELEKVNPEVAKSDFTDLQSVINSF